MTFDPRPGSQNDIFDVIRSDLFQLGLNCQNTRFSKSRLPSHASCLTHAVVADTQQSNHKVHVVRALFPVSCLIQPVRGHAGLQRLSGIFKRSQQADVKTSNAKVESININIVFWNGKSCFQSVFRRRGQGGRTRTGGEQNSIKISLSFFISFLFFRSICTYVSARAHMCNSNS